MSTKPLAPSVLILEHNSQSASTKHKAQSCNASLWHPLLIEIYLEVFSCVVVPFFACRQVSKSVNKVS